MTEDERQDWLDMKRTLAQYLPTLEGQIIEFAVDGDEDEYQFLLKKAIEHRNTIIGINKILGENEP